MRPQGWRGKGRGRRGWEDSEVGEWRGLGGQCWIQPHTSGSDQEAGQEQAAGDPGQEATEASVWGEGGR